MKLNHKIRLFVLLQIGVCLLVGFLFWKLKLPLAFAFLLCMLECGVLIYLVRTVGDAIAHTEEELQKCIQLNGTEDDILKNLSTDNVFLENIKIIVEKSVEQITRENSAEMFDKQAKLTALQSQINPHFLYNTLESIRGQALIDGNDEIARMMKALSSFFRYSISRKGNLVTLRDELNNIENYMTIQRYRFNNRFSLEIFIDEEDEEVYDYLIPRLIIQPIVENAIYHGLEECLAGGKVEIEVILTEKNLIITVSDNGLGMTAKNLEEINNRIHTVSAYMSEKEESIQVNTGIALPNIHKRIQLLFGDEYGIQVYSTLNQGTDVEITIPANYERTTR